MAVMVVSLQDRLVAVFRGLTVVKRAQMMCQRTGMVALGMSLRGFPEVLCDMFMGFGGREKMLDGRMRHEVCPFQIISLDSIAWHRVAWHGTA